MVGRRKQRKSSRAGGKRPEPTTSAPDLESPLVSLPPEIQGIVISYVNTPTSTSNAVDTCKYYFADRVVLACSTTRPEPSLLHLSGSKCNCSPYTLPHYRVEGSAAMGSTSFPGKPPCILVRRSPVYAMLKDRHETIPSKRQQILEPRKDTPR